MKFSISKIRIGTLVGIFALIAGWIVLTEAAPPAKKKGFEEFVSPGDADSAREYYAFLAEEMGYLDDKPPYDAPRDIDELLGYFGYGGLRAGEFERLSPETLMDTDLLAADLSPKDKERFDRFFRDLPLQKDEILCTRFFSPKSTDVSRSAEGRAYAWRKIVRLKARDGSRARKKGFSALFFMFNFYEKDLGKSPFEKHSKTNQAILLRAPGAKLRNPLYWMIFDTLERKGVRGAYLNSSWDAADPDLERDDPNAPESHYYAPDSCATCHGGRSKPSARFLYPQATLNYIDTDHLFDRIQPDNDFAKLGQSNLGVVYDGGKDTATMKFTRAFDVIRKLNSEIYAFNRSVDENGFLARAPKNWLDLHAKTEQYIPLLQRAIKQDGPAKRVWSADNPIDRELLPMLDRYCFRCHSAVKYHVYDKEEFWKRVASGKVEQFVSGDDPMMPQDRRLPKEAQARLLELIGKLKQQEAKKP